MKLTRLRLAGFKTFADSGEVLIEPGLTGIVGPNGCGKSNLVEALRWAMGESSYKAMRAGGMDEVIFAGNGARPARNAAEVTLVLDNSARLAPPAFNDAESLEVTRRIVREAGSAYRVNGRDVRARDVQLLFADASTGACSPALVRQGQIGELIAQKPESRRLILEEAAGITGLHSRRHEAQIRLRNAEQNLERLDDVLAELARQCESLKRQARQAARYRALSREIREGEARILLGRLDAAREALSQAEAARRADADTAEAAGTRASQAALAQARAAHGLPARKSAAEEAAEALRARLSQLEALETERARAEERIEDLQEHLRRLDEDETRERESLRESEEALAGLGETGEDTAVPPEADPAETEARARLEACEREAREAQTRLREAEAETGRRTGERRTAEALAEQWRAQTRRLETERDQAAREARQARGETREDAELRAAEDEARSAETALQDSEARLAEARLAARAARTREEEARTAREAAERHLGALDTEAATLRALVGNEDGEDEIAGALLPHVRVAPGLEAAFGALLGEAAEAGTDPAAPRHWASLGTRHGPPPPLPQGAEPLDPHVEAPAALARALAHAGIVARADGPGLQPLLRPGQALVSREGDLWRWDGYAARAEAPGRTARLLAERNRLAEIEARADEARDLCALARRTHETMRAKSRAAAAAEDEAAGADRAARDRLSAARDAGAALATARERARARMIAREEAETRAARALADSAQGLAEAEAALETARAETAAETALPALRAGEAQAREAREGARQGVETLARERAVREERAQAALRERGLWAGRREAGEARLERLRARREKAAASLHALQGEPGRLREARLSLAGAREAAERERADTAAALETAEADLARADRESREAEKALAEAREAAARSDTRAEAATARAGEAERRIAEAFECTPEALRRTLPTETGAPAAPERLEGEVEALKRERERLGAVNLRAEEEASEAQAKHDSLRAEHDDLTGAIRQLRQAIASLNTEGRERLAAAFDTVNGHFQALFATLFGGGSARLVLTGADDPLEAGLDVVAEPPGKRPQTLTLLSGGEQALTALAMIFAVFLTNPAPICVLDEVDAPLDDANVERFCTLIDEMRRRTETRFLIITHNPITMARMDRLFGVTMAERGVSRIVSVDLRAAERFVENGSAA